VRLDQRTPTWRASVSRWGAALAAVLITGCATPPASRPDGPAPLAGRLALQIQATASLPARQDTVAFELSGSATSGELVLTSMIGTVVAKAQWRPGVAELSTSQGSRHYPNVEALAADALGEPLPLHALADWLRGRPWAGAPHSPLEGGFEQAGWAVNTAALAQGLLTARRTGPPAVTLRARLEAP
jgi:outer membrane lipoprotein LolB